MKLRVVLLTLASVFALITHGPFAAQKSPPTYPTQIVYVHHDDLTQAVTKGNLAGMGTNELIPRDTDLGVRVSVGKKAATPPVTGAEAHETFGHVYRIEEGEGTLVLGGELVNPTERAPGEWRGSAIQGGQTFHLTEGDLITVQVGMPHQWTEVSEGGIAYLAFHSFPERNQPAAN